MINCIAVRFQIRLDEKVGNSEEYVRVERNVFNEKYREFSYSGVHGNDYSKLQEEYFTKDRIEKMKEELCKKIMESENPFKIEATSSDSYEIEESKIWK